MRLSTQRFLAILVALAFVAAGGRAAVLAQDDAENAGPAGQPPVGSAVSYIGEEGSELGTITVIDYVDPFEDYDACCPPDRGNRFIEVGLTVESTGRRAFPFLTSGTVYLQDAEGFLYSTTFLVRSEVQTQDHPDVPYEEVAAGESVTGYLYFSVFSDAEIVRIVYTDGYQRLIFLGDLTVEPLIELGGGGGGGGTPSADDGDGGDDGAPADDGGDGDDSGDGGTGQFSDQECEDITAWYDDAEARFSTLEESFGILSEENPDPDAVRDLASQLQDLADEQADADVPEPAQEANDALLALMQGFADALNDYADALESGEASDEALATIFSGLEPLVTEFDTLIQDLAEACDIDTE